MSEPCTRIIGKPAHDGWNVNDISTVFRVLNRRCAQSELATRLHMCHTKENDAKHWHGIATCRVSNQNAALKNTAWVMKTMQLYQHG